MAAIIARGVAALGNVRDAVRSGRMGRRTFLGGLAAGAVGAGAVLAGCATAGSAKPVSQGAPVTLVFDPWQNVFYTATTTKMADQQLAVFEAAHKGIKVKQTNYYAIGALPGSVAATVAGTGPDVVFDTTIAPYLAANLLLPLDKYIQEDGLSRTSWSKSLMSMFTTPSGTFGLPVYQGAAVFAVRQDIFDKMGVPYPDSSWQYTDFLDICQKLYVPESPTQPAQIGATLFCGGLPNTKPNSGGENFQDSDWLFRGFGGSIFNSDTTQCNLGSPETIQAGRFLYHQLYWPKIASTAYSYQGLNNNFLHGVAGLCSVLNLDLSYMIEQGQDIKWYMLPMPNFPKGRSTFGVGDFYGISAQCPHPDAAWELLKWVSYEPTWQRFWMKALFSTPASNGLWAEWESDVVQAAPALKGKGLHWMADAAINNYAWPTPYGLAGQQQINVVIGQINRGLSDQSMTSVSTAFTTAAQSINAILATAVPLYQAEQVAEKQLQQAQSSTKAVTFTAPPATGAGTPATDAKSLVTGSGSSWTLTGDGFSMVGIVDNCVFASLPETASTGTYTCRLDSLENVSCPSLSPLCHVGIMARGDLSNDAPMVLVSVTGGNGVRVSDRNTASANAQFYAAPAQGSKSGLISASYITQLAPPVSSTSASKSGSTTSSSASSSSSSGPIDTSNMLLHPVWLRLVRSAESWQAYTSLDGTTWTKAGPAVRPVMAGAWLGLYACAYWGGFKGVTSGTIRASFSQVSFVPTTFSQIGMA